VLTCCKRLTPRVFSRFASERFLHSVCVRHRRGFNRLASVDQGRRRPEVLFHAEMQAASAVARESSFRETDGWEGPFTCPRSVAKRDSQRHFFARISGATKVYPFLQATDSVTISRSHGGEALQSLIDSNFVATEWAIREDATHSKSKTYRCGSQVLTRTKLSGPTPASSRGVKMKKLLEPAELRSRGFEALVKSLGWVNAFASSSSSSAAAITTRLNVTRCTELEC